MLNVIGPLLTDRLRITRIRKDCQATSNGKEKVSLEGLLLYCTVV